MPFAFDSAVCSVCPADIRCIEDRRENRVRGRNTVLRVLQNNAIQCTFEAFVPGFEPGTPSSSYEAYLKQWEANAQSAATYLFPDAAAALTTDQVAKTAGDVLQNLLAAGLWNVAADWNALMDTGVWPAGPLRAPNAIPCPDRKVAIITLPRGYEVTQLFTEASRKKILAFNHALKLQGMQLRLSSPDIVGVRLPDPLPPECEPFLKRLPDLRKGSRELLENAYKALLGRIEGNGFLFAVAVKRSVRSDRLYQPLFEANVLKYLVTEVLRGASLKFNVMVMDPEGAAVAEHYKAASVVSLMRGGKFERAIDKLMIITSPMDVLSEILAELPTFHI